MPEDRVHHEHDVGYKYIFSHKETFLELLHGFVKKDWVNLIKSEDLMLIDKSYILEDFSEEESDIVYRVNVQGQDVIFYILLEFQSSVDYRMPMRLLFYIVEIWREILKNTPRNDRRKKDFKLPSIIPMVLYNGKNTWTAYRNFKDVLSGSKLFEENVVDFRYMLFDIYRYDERYLENMANMVSTVFLLDKEISREDLIRRLRLTAYVLKKITPEQFDILKTWLKGIMRPRLDSESKIKIEEILEKSGQEEVDSMVSNLGKTIDNIIREGKKTGLEEGRKQGRKEGRKEGKSELIIKILIKKFKNLPDGYADKISNLPDETLDVIATDIFDIDKMEQLEKYF
ncbi:MAG: Rpn family recombination-promoting nuclease/putative transposase [Clostridium sp.]|jgi:predicted transposase/invertase (TIGR01784 family)|uniref:Rpn family recombination-promoting nuclease/putative transposase n=1 Tax=Clostridium sp. TaxID=1506 RepID=UPI0025BC1C6C|nr:Rpn family recombination-promoting nuclease/putative transposase [Clostridium sp.]MCH3965127.1 Rpn family recombination-promoting nuclease/putative transposase [Clostridium sp.]MCI1714348.1 Rpn family recombination-promoting nuclease/putative transposase [Clostridium sp.]MCI1798610.1 Rpn family recombination-promoting nuclease/putative transposase [Clostridium sp.]MCI1812659.1 Rpn family recombination-promoting nuclease/putative transposase [Clostridium sp.]MCI1869419.1 Rpn family recombina